MKTTSRSTKIAQKTIYAAFIILKEAGGEMRGKEVVDKIRETVEFDDYEIHVYEKTGYIRWESVFHFYTIDCMKAGYLRKQKGVWYLTDEGEKAIQLGPEKLLETATEKYREWDTKNKKKKVDSPDEIEGAGEKAQKQIALLDQYESRALDGIREYIIDKNPYEFQDMVSALLKAMGYYIAFIAPKGRDGGIDIIAYTDPLGVKSPRIIVQVKHRPDTSISSDDIQRLSGTMKRSSDFGLFVTSGSFSSPAFIEARSADKHIELIDFTKFVNLWQEYYTKMPDDDKNLLPLQPIYFLGSNE
ncbi:MAG: Mrr restriction system protein [Bacteroidales bacterium]|nr:Mrr restriction system protein [Bacteroidales bacterium]